jgi:hypothetical protein
MNGGHEMRSVECKTVYFETPRKHNTESVLELVKRYAQTEGTRDIVVASTTGETGVEVSSLLRGFNGVVVSHNVGFQELGVGGTERRES